MWICSNGSKNLYQVPYEIQDFIATYIDNFNTNFLVFIKIIEY